MRIIKYEDIVHACKGLCIDAAYNLPDDVMTSFRESLKKEHSDIGKYMLENLIKNAEIAKNKQMPICQDTGLAVYFVEIGNEVIVDEGELEDAINEGTKAGYIDGYLRKSVVNDPLFNRINTKTNTPAIIHTKVVKGDKIKITLAPKGGGSENMSRIKMLKPLEGVKGIEDFVINTIKEAGGNPCPPVIVGIGIGGDFEQVAILAKKSLLRTVGHRNTNKDYAKLELDLLEKINKTNVGPQGLGGLTTALDVHIEYAPCHIASLPVAINLNCHAARHSEIIL